MGACSSIWRSIALIHLVAPTSSSSSHPPTVTHQVSPAPKLHHHVPTFIINLSNTFHLKNVVSTGFPPFSRCQDLTLHSHRAPVLLSSLAPPVADDPIILLRSQLGQFFPQRIYGSSPSTGTKHYRMYTSSAPPFPFSFFSTSITTLFVCPKCKSPGFPHPHPTSEKIQPASTTHARTHT